MLMSNLLKGQKVWVFNSKEMWPLNSARKLKTTILAGPDAHKACACVCAHIYIFLFSCVCTCKHMSVSVCVSACVTDAHKVCVCVYVHMYICLCVCVRALVCVCVCACVTDVHKVCAFMCVHMSMFVSLFACVTDARKVWVCVCVDIYICLCLHLRLHVVFKLCTVGHSVPTTVARCVLRMSHVCFTKETLKRDLHNYLRVQQKRTTDLHR